MENFNPRMINGNNELFGNEISPRRDDKIPSLILHAPQSTSMLNIADKLSLGVITTSAEGAVVFPCRNST